MKNPKAPPKNNLNRNSSLLARSSTPPNLIQKIMQIRIQTIAKLLLLKLWKTMGIKKFSQTSRALLTKANIKRENPWTLNSYSPVQEKIGKVIQNLKVRNRRLSVRTVKNMKWIWRREKASVRWRTISTFPKSCQFIKTATKDSTTSKRRSQKLSNLEK